MGYATSPLNESVLPSQLDNILVPISLFHLGGEEQCGLTLFYIHRNWSIFINIHALYYGVSDERSKPIIVGVLYINGKGTPSAFIQR